MNFHAVSLIVVNGVCYRLKTKGTDPTLPGAGVRSIWVTDDGREHLASLDWELGGEPLFSQVESEIRRGS